MKTRRHLVNFRLTDDEYGILKDACSKFGARSVSDYVRDAVLQSLHVKLSNGNGGSLHRQAEELEHTIHRLTSLLQELGTSFARQARDNGADR